MKKLMALMMVLAISLTTFAQKKAVVVKREDEVKHTSTVPQKMHNLFSKHKHYNGYKTKHTKRVKYVKH